MRATVMLVGVGSGLLAVQGDDLGPHHARRLTFGRSRHHRSGMAVDVVQLGRSALLGFPDGRCVLGEDPGDLGGRVVHVPRDDRVLGADHHAGRLHAVLHAVCAEVALGGRAGFRVDVDRVVGTGLHARLAADALLAIELDDSIVSLVHRGDGADPGAGRILAVVAARDLEVTFRVGVATGLGVLHPGAVHADRDLVLALAGRRARVAPDALAVVDDEAVVQWVLGVGKEDGDGSCRSTVLQEPSRRAILTGSGSSGGRFVSLVSPDAL